MTKVATGAFSIVSVVDEEGELSDYVRQLHAPSRGVVVVLTRPNGRRSSWVGSDIVSSLGKTGVVDPERASNDSFAYAQCWLVAEDIRDVLFLSAQWMRTADLMQVLQLAVFAQLRVWLVFDTYVPEPLHNLLCRWGAERVQAKSFRRKCRQSLQTEDLAVVPQNIPREFPEVPANTFPTFYAQAKRELRGEEFALFDSSYRRAFGEAYEWFADGVLTHENLGQKLHELTRTAVATSEVITLLRAVQAAAFRHGVLVKVRLGSFLAHANHTGSLSRLKDEQWERVGRSCKPREAAVATLTVVGLNTREIADLTPQDVAHDGSSVRCKTGRLDVPEPGRRYLVAQHLMRLAGALRNTNSFLATTDRNTRDVSPRRIARMLTFLTAHTGIAFRHRQDLMDTSRSRLLIRCGLSFHRLPERVSG